MIRTLNLDFAYAPDDGTVLWDINIEINKGEIVSILGPNGSGKTTLVRHFNALLLPSSGDVYVDGLDTRERRNHRKIREMVSLVFQNPLDQFIGLTVSDDLALPLRMRGESDKSIKSKVGEMLDMFNLKNIKDRYPHKISGGEQKLLTIAAALIVDPKVIVLDEPTVMLDKGRKKIVHEHLMRMNKEHGKTVVISTTDPYEASLADRIYVIKEGEIACSGKPKEVFKKKKFMEEIGVGVPV